MIKGTLSMVRCDSSERGQLGMDNVACRRPAKLVCQSRTAKRGRHTYLPVRRGLCCGFKLCLVGIGSKQLLQVVLLQAVEAHGAQTGQSGRDGVGLS